MAQIVLNGIRGPITVNGTSYGAQEMPAQKGALSDQRIAQVITYVRERFGGITDTVVTKEMIADARNRHGERAAQYTAGELAARDAMLPGEQPAWMNPETDAVDGKNSDGGKNSGDGKAPAVNDKAPESKETK